MEARPQGQPEGDTEVELVVGDGPSTAHAEASAGPAAVDGGGVRGSARKGSGAASHQLRAAEATAPGRPPQTLVACLRCGAYGTRYARNLAGTCHGATTTTLQSQRARLADGRHPGHRQCRTWVLSTLREPTSADLAACLGPDFGRAPVAGPTVGPQMGSGAPRRMLTRVEILAAYGLNEEDVEAAVNRWRQRRRARATEEVDSDIEE